MSQNEMRSLSFRKNGKNAFFCTGCPTGRAAPPILRWSQSLAQLSEADRLGSVLCSSRGRRYFKKYLKEIDLGWKKDYIKLWKIVTEMLCGIVHMKEKFYPRQDLEEDLDRLVKKIHDSWKVELNEAHIKDLKSLNSLDRKGCQTVLVRIQHSASEVLKSHCSSQFFDFIAAKKDRMMKKALGMKEVNTEE